LYVDVTLINVLIQIMSRRQPSEELRRLWLLVTAGYLIRLSFLQQVNFLL